MSDILYKYYSPERVSVLEDSLMRFTPLDLLNDPVEGRFSLGPPPSEAGRAEQDGYGAEWAQVEVFLSSRMAVLGALCLSRNPESHAMWAHYSDEGRGFVIGVSREARPFEGRASVWSDYRTEINLQEVPGFGSFRDVEYRDEPYSIEFGGEVPWGAFFAKRTEWSYEREVRIFRTLADADVTIPAKPRDVSLFRLAPAAVTEVVVGWRADPDVLAAAQRMRQRTEFGHVRFLQATIDHRRKQIRFEPLPTS